MFVLNGAREIGIKNMAQNFKHSLNTDKKYLDNRIYLKPGEVYIAKEPTVVWTTLGSCVSIIFYSPQQHVSSICHAQLPTRDMPNGACSARCPVKCMQDSDKANEYKYVSCSIRYMLKTFQNIGITKKDIHVKLFGGAQVIARKNASVSVGEKNIETARQLIKNNNLKIVSENIGGYRGRTIYFYSDTGEILLKKHSNPPNP